MEAAQARLDKAIVDCTLLQPTRAVPDGADMVVPTKVQAQPDRAVDETQAQPEKVGSDDAQAQPEMASFDGAEPQPDQAGPFAAQAQPQTAVSDAAQAQQQAADVDGAQPPGTRVAPGGDQVQAERLLPSHVADTRLLQHSPDQHCKQRQHGEQQAASLSTKPACQDAQPRKR